MSFNGHPKHAIIGFDGTRRCEGAVRAALELNRQFGTTFEVLHAIDLPSQEWIYGRPDLVGEMEASIEARTYEALADDLAGLARDQAEGTLLREALRVGIGKPAQFLISRARESQADLVVIGPHVKKGRMDFGSVARAVLGKAPCAVWVQPEGEVPEINRILVPLDISEESLAALKSATAMAAELGASIVALHVFQPPDVAYAASPGYPVVGPTYVVDDVRKLALREFEETMASFDWKGVPHEIRFEEGRPSEVILAQASEVELVAMGTHGRTGLASALLGNVAYTVLQRVSVPVMCMRQASRGWLLG